MDSIIAAAGSNGVVAVWSVRNAFLLESDGSTSSSMVSHQQPEAILSQHSRAVNRLAWHPRRPGLLLTASQVRKKNGIGSVSVVKASVAPLLSYFLIV